MLKKCEVCERLFKGEGDTCSKCKNKKGATRELGECKDCGVITKNRVEGYCFNCALDEVDHFKIAREYLYLNPGVSIKGLSKATGVPVEEINNYVREERLDIKEGVSASDKRVCVDCGKEIKNGSLCLSCKRNREELDKLKNSKPKEKKKEKKNKFFLNKDK